jgi:PAS domain S-box-containing protein
VPLELVENLEKAALILGGAVRRVQAIESAHETEQTYQTLVSTIDEGVILQESSGKILIWNHAAERIFGVSAAEVIGSNSLDHKWNTFREDGSEFLGQDHPSLYTLRTGEVCKNVVMGVRSTTGKVFSININTNPLFSENDKKPYAVVVSFSDITLRKQAEEILQQSEGELSAIYHSSPVYMFLVNSYWEVVKSNRAVQEYAGEQRDLISVLRCGDLFHCVNAGEDPAGCGFGKECETCIVRASILDTLASGQPHCRREACIKTRKEGKLGESFYLVSTNLLLTGQDRLVLT